MTNPLSRIVHGAASLETIIQKTQSQDTESVMLTIFLRSTDNPDQLFETKSKGIKGIYESCCRFFTRLFSQQRVKPYDLEANLGELRNLYDQVSKISDVELTRSFDRLSANDQAFVNQRYDKDIRLLLNDFASKIDFIRTHVMSSLETRLQSEHNLKKQAQLTSKIEGLQKIHFPLFLTNKQKGQIESFEKKSALKIKTMEGELSNCCSRKVLSGKSSIKEAAESIDALLKLHETLKASFSEAYKQELEQVRNLGPKEQQLPVQDRCSELLAQLSAHKDSLVEKCVTQLYKAYNESMQAKLKSLKSELTEQFQRRRSDEPATLAESARQEELIQQFITKRDEFIEFHKEKISEIKSYLPKDYPLTLQEDKEQFIKAISEHKDLLIYKSVEKKLSLQLGPLRKRLTSASATSNLAEVKGAIGAINMLKPFLDFLKGQVTSHPHVTDGRAKELITRIDDFEAEMVEVRLQLVQKKPALKAKESETQSVDVQTAEGTIVKARGRKGNIVVVGANASESDRRTEDVFDSSTMFNETIALGCMMITTWFMQGMNAAIILGAISALSLTVEQMITSKLPPKFRRLLRPIVRTVLTAALLKYGISLMQKSASPLPPQAEPQHAAPPTSPPDSQVPVTGQTLAIRPMPQPSLPPQTAVPTARLALPDRPSALPTPPVTESMPQAAQPVIDEAQCTKVWRADADSINDLGVGIIRKVWESIASSGI